MKFNLQAIKSIPITDVLNYVGFEVSRQGKWLSVKGDDSLKVDAKKNTYYDFSSKYGQGTTIDLVMNTQKVDFQRACEILTNQFLGGLPLMTDFKPAPLQAKPKQSTTMKKYLPHNLVAALLDTKHYANNNLFKFLQRFNAAPEAMQALNVGTTKDGHAAFLYQNAESQYEFVKVMPYSAETGKRSGDIIVPKGYQSTDGYAAQCFFNEVAVKSAEFVFIVESEKTAVIATLYFKNPNFAFIATGGAQKLAGLLRAKESLLADKKVVLLPDNDEAGSAWMPISVQFRETYDSIQAWILDADAPEKSDLADLIIADTPTWKATFKTLYNKLKGVEEKPQIQPIIKKETQAEMPKYTFTETQKSDLSDFRHRFELQKAAPTESEIYWAKRDAEKAKKPDTSAFSELKKFFDKQVLPDMLHFYNYDGCIYETLNNPTLYVVQQIATAEELISENRLQQSETCIYQLQRIKDVLQKGGYMLSKKADEVPF